MAKEDKENCARVGSDLQDMVSGQVLYDRLTRAMYSTDASIYCIEPLCVVFPKTEKDVISTVAYAAEKGIPLVPRGGGSGLAGESLCRGIVIDFSRNMNRIIHVDREAGLVTVQAGLVLEQLNRRLFSLGKQFGPDPASGNRATIGGMIGNNATGAHSLVYGYTGDNVVSLKVVLATAKSTEITREFTDSPADEFSTSLAGVADIFRQNEELLRRARPRSERNGSGYNIFPAWQEGKLIPTQLFSGAEGTLAVITEATLKLVDVPRLKMMLQVNFDSLGKMARAIPYILQHSPSACELMDGRLLEMARQAYPEYSDVLPDKTAASLVVEFSGQDESALRNNLRKLRIMLEGLTPSARCTATLEIIDPRLQGRIWQARKAAVPLLYRNKSAAQPIPVVEDIAVPTDKMAEYIEGLEDITRRMNIPMAYYAHAGHGEIHPRPFLDLHKKEDVRKMRRLAEEVFKLVWSLGGTISGEHGEGLVRASFIRDQYGPEVYEIFCRIKNIFDPHKVLNPGKIINDDPDIMIRNLRFERSSVRDDYRGCLVFRDNELVREIEQCNGNGLCRSSDPLLTMCPVFRATGEEAASPRAKANLMRHWLYGQLPQDILQSDEFKRIADLCINCKMCALQCPSLVNIPKLMVEARAAYVRKHGLTRAQWMLTRSELMSRLGTKFAPVANVFLGAGIVRYLMEKTVGLDRRRPLPKFAWGANLGKLRRYIKKLSPVEQPVDKIAYFVDLYANYNSHELGRAVVNVLHHNRVEVIIPRQQGAGMPALSYGDIDYVRRNIEFNLYHLAKVVRQGYKIVCSEPTAALCLKEEYLDVVDSDEARLVAKNTYELTDYLAGLHQRGHLDDDFIEVPLKLAYHKPCHYLALQISEGTEFLLSLIDGVEVVDLPNSCCGIAGTFGFQKKNFDLSMQAGAPMLNELRQCKADYGLTECGTCKMQMEFGGGKQVLHPVQVLARAYGF